MEADSETPIFPVSTAGVSPWLNSRVFSADQYPNPSTRTSARSCLPGGFGDGSLVVRRQGANAVLLLPLGPQGCPPPTHPPTKLQDPRQHGILIAENLEKLHSPKNEIAIIVSPYLEII